MGSWLPPTPFFVFSWGAGFRQLLSVFSWGSRLSPTPTRTLSRPGPSLPLRVTQDFRVFVVIFSCGAGFRQLLRVLKKQSFVEHLPRPFPPLSHGVPEPGTFDKLNKSPNERPKRTEVPRPKNTTQIGAEGRLTPFLRKKISRNQAHSGSESLSGLDFR